MIGRNNYYGWEMAGRWFAILFTLFLLFFVLTSCTTVTDHRPLAEQRLSPRPGYPGLSNQVCKKRTPFKCEEWSIVDYDLRDPAVRKRLRDVRLICSVGGRRYRIDQRWPGLIRTETQGRWPMKKLKIVDYIDIVSGHQRLLDAKTWCASQNSLLGRSMFQH